MSPAPSEPRALAPDLARGAMLLVIALAHAQVLSAGNTAGGPPGQVVAALHTLLVDSRGYPMFAALFGYGLAQLLRRRGADDATARLRRRGRWLVAFGFFHSLLLFYGDILGAYGLLSLLLLRSLDRPDARLLSHAAGWAVVGALAFGVAARFIPDGAEAVADPRVSAGLRVIGWFVATPLFAVMAAGPVLFGVWAARHRLLELPARHVAALRLAAGVGIGTAVIGAFPLVVLEAHADSSAPALAAATALHTLTGYAGGLGYAALVAVVAARVGERRGPLLTALVACGQRSLSCYLAQSLAWLLLFEPYFAALGGALTPTVAAAIGFGVWALTVVLANVLRRLDRSGPAEALLRRLTRGR